MLWREVEYETVLLGRREAVGRTEGGCGEDHGRMRESEEGGALGIGCREQLGAAGGRVVGGGLAHPGLCVWCWAFRGEEELLI